MDIQQRIAQFENMAQADPSNEMAHFSLGRAYGEAGRWRDAAAAFLRCTEVMPDMSKAFQMAGEAFVKAGLVDDAALTLTKGYEVASLKGDLMPKRAMAELLKSIGKPVPEVDGAAEIEAARALSGAFVCAKSGRPGTKLAKPPFRGVVGAWIYENISSETWNAWIGQGTKVINELRLDLSRDQDAETYDRHMREYLGIDDALLARLRAGAGA